MSDFCDQEELAETVREEDLIDSALGRRAELDRMTALNELQRRRSPQRGMVLNALLLDSAAPAELRSTAALALGKEVTPQAEDVLIAALQTAPVTVVRRAAESLGRIGGRRALEALRQVRVAPDGAPARSVAFARVLISYRLGLGTDRLQPPSPADMLTIEPGRGVELRFEPIAVEAFRAAAASLQEVLPGIPVAERGSVRFFCRSEHLWIVLSEETAAPEGLARLASRDAVAAVVLKESSCPDGWYVNEYILTHPRDTQTLELVGVRPTGVMTHSGEVDLSRPEAAVQLRALNTPYGPAIIFEATVGGAAAGFIMTRAVVAAAASERQKRPAVPVEDVVRVQ
jgi:HEAT repeats